MSSAAALRWMLCLLSLGWCTPALDVWEAYPDGTAWGGTLCVTGTPLCRSYAHLVLNVKPDTSAIATDVVGGGDWSTDGGVTWTAGTAAVFETHLVLDNTTQVWTWNWDALANASAGETAPSSLCARPWFRSDAGTGSGTTLEPICANLDVTFVQENPVVGAAKAEASAAASIDGGSGNGGSGTGSIGTACTVGGAELMFGNWTVACSASLALCRVLGHVAVDAAAAPAVVSPILVGGGDYSFDGGATFTNDNDAGSGLTWLAHFDDTAEAAEAGAAGATAGGAATVTAQRFHWAADVRLDELYDPLVPSSKPALDEICWRVWFNTSAGTDTAFVNMNISSDPSWYSGYALAPTVRCWHVGEVLELP